MVKCGVPTITKSAISQLENYNFNLPVRHLDWTHNHLSLIINPHWRPRRINNRNSRASESKASSSLECSAERSRESTKLTFCCVKLHEQPL